ncbi:MAG: cation transporter [Candidatus Micrarchaeota archaeon]|nr:cation transporter [Candidatus Micrarchaeota archaeon]
MKHELKVSGMHCSSCEMLIADALGEIPGVKSARADAKSGRVSFDAADGKALAAAKKAIAKEGYKVQ